MSKTFQPEKITADFVAFRRASFFGAIIATTGLGVWLLWKTFLPEGISALEWVQLVLFLLLFQQIATGFWLAVFGFITAIAGGDRAQIARTIDEADLSAPTPPTAVVIPIYNEDVVRVFGGIEAMWQGLKDAGGNEGFDFFILSDSNKPENWLHEEMAWLDLCKRLNAFGRIFYRKRRTPRNAKSGNVADFCRRWGARYRYMIVLDADSVMTGSILKRLTAMMEKHPRVGLIQTTPQLALGRTPFRRMYQFAAKLYAPLFCAGSNYWHLFGGNYWGHNAIIRVRPFIEHCDLPDLPEKDAKRRHIFSHDTVEAALMRRAGYDVWFAYAEPGSYEEGPPNLSDSLGRDRRWCMGNLQHFWFLFAPGVDFANRFHIWMGVMGYMGSLLWLIFLIVGAFDLAVKHRFSVLSALPGDPVVQSGGAVMILLASTFVLLFLPKILSYLVALPKARKFGGYLRLTLGVILETIISTLMAPVLMIYYSQFVVSLLAGLQAKWGSQNRTDDKGMTILESCRIFWLPPVLGAISLAVLIVYAPHEILLLSPILGGWLLAPFLAWATSQPALGDFLIWSKIFFVSEEDPKECPRELEKVRQIAQEAEDNWNFPYSGVARAVTDPLANAVHIALLRQRRRVVEETEEYLEELREKLLENGPSALDIRQQFALLWDADSLRWLHREFWTRPADRLHPWWRERLRDATARVGNAAAG